LDDVGKAREFGKGFAAAIHPVEKDDPVRGHPVNGRHHMAVDAHHVLGGGAAGFVDQVEAEPGCRHALVAPGKHLPMGGEGGQGLVVRPQVLRLRGRVHAVSRRAMERERDMETMLLAPGDGLVEVAQHIFAEGKPLVFDRVAAVVHGQADVVEAEFLDEREVFLTVRSVHPIDSDFLHEVEPVERGGIEGQRRGRRKGRRNAAQGGKDDYEKSHGAGMIRPAEPCRPSGRKI